MQLLGIQCDIGKIGGLLSDLYPSKLGSTGKTGRVTTGAEAMFLALTSCAQVDTYEMVPSRHAQESRFHYYGRLSVKANLYPTVGYHSTWASEHDLWARLSHEPLSRIKKTGKASIVGFPQLKDCPQNISSRSISFMKPFFVDWKHEPKWKPSKKLLQQQNELGGTHEGLVLPPSREPALLAPAAGQVVPTAVQSLASTTPRALEDWVPGIISPVPPLVPVDTWMWDAVLPALPLVVALLCCRVMRRKVWARPLLLTAVVLSATAAIRGSLEHLGTVAMPESGSRLVGGSLAKDW